MPIDVEFLRDGTYIRVTGRGVVTDDEYRRHVEKIYDSEARTRRYRCALSDWSRVKKVEISTDAIREAAPVFLQAAEIVPKGAVVALVAPKPLVYGLARMWEAYVAKTGWATRIFEDGDEAERWLELKLAEGKTVEGEQGR